MKHETFDLLKWLIPELRALYAGDTRRSEMAQLAGKDALPLCLDVISNNGFHAEIVLAHYIERDGRNIPSPEMRVKVDFAERTAVPISFANRNMTTKVDADASPERQEAVTSTLAAFLRNWLRDCADRGYQFVPETQKCEANKARQTL